MSSTTMLVTTVIGGVRQTDRRTDWATFRTGDRS